MAIGRALSVILHTLVSASSAHHRTGMPRDGGLVCLLLAQRQQIDARERRAAILVMLLNTCSGQHRQRLRQRLCAWRPG
jgi:hypothetical protein